MTQPTLEQIPSIIREQLARLTGAYDLPDNPLLHVRAQTRNAFRNALRGALAKHLSAIEPEYPLLVCVSSSELRQVVDDFLTFKPGGMMEWAFPDLVKIPRTDWHYAPPMKMIGSYHLTDIRSELKLFAETICGMYLPEPPWRGFFASGHGRTIVSIGDDLVNSWLSRDGYVEIVVR